MCTRVTVAVQGDWFGTSAEQNGQKISGWIAKPPSPTALSPPPPDGSLSSLGIEASALEPEFGARRENDCAQEIHAILYNKRHAFDRNWALSLDGIAMFVGIAVLRL